MPVTYTTSIFFLLLAITVAALLMSLLLTWALLKHSNYGRLKIGHHLLMTVCYTVAVAGLILTIFYGIKMAAVQEPDDTSRPPETTTSPTGEPTTEPTAEPTVPPTTEPPTEPTIPDYSLPEVGKTESSDPKNWNVSWDIIAGGSIVSDYQREDRISFADPNKYGYGALPGIFSFRGDNYRTGAVWGTAAVKDKVLTDLWSREISAIEKGTGSGFWTGCGWTGQPLMAQWDAETRQIMNLYPEKKAKDGLVEVIYATLDGHIYFYDLEDGTYTRDPMNVGMAFKGAGSLDPRGYPLMYVGAGDRTSSGKAQRMFVISLIDCTVQFEYGNGDDWRHRSWTAFDSAPLVSADTDTLIWPGESGILYTMKLNTAYDKTAGTLSVKPDQIVRTRYTTSSNRTLGYENSAIAVENYLYVADNGGMLFCIDLNTMKLLWAQDLRDDINASLVFEWDEDGTGYLYAGSSMEYCDGSVYMYKINASTGEIVWECHIDGVYYDKAVSGGILSSPELGRKGTPLEGMIFWSISRAPDYGNGILMALNTETGEILYESRLDLYCWSSPLAVYTDSGEAYLILCDSAGNVMLKDPLTGNTLHSINIGSNIEASPAMFNDILVVGTRGMQVHGIKIS